MNKFILAAALAIVSALCGTSASAADLTRGPVVRKTVVAEAAVAGECLRWIRQTQAWYNYCEPVPYYGHPPSHYEWPWYISVRR